MSLYAKCLLWLFMITTAWQTGYGQDNFLDLTAKIEYKAAATNGSKLFDALQKQSGYHFLFDRNTFDKISLTDLRYNNTTLGNVLQSLHKNQGWLFSVSGKNIAAKPGSRPTVPASKTPGKVTGKIIDEETGQPVPNVTIRIGDRGIMTDTEGVFTLQLPAGKYTARISSVGYGSKEVDDIEVKDNHVFNFNATLKREKGQLLAVVVKSSARKETVNALYARQKNNAAVSDGISAEQISRTPDNNAAQVLKRVSGLQVTDNKFVVVRGLSDRYNNVLLNGAMLPSSEPNKRNFAFDMIPSALLDRIIVNKTATPDLTGEFTGGLVQIETKDIPAENFLQITVGTGYNTQSTGKEMIGLDRGSNAYAGFRSDIHKKPSGMSFGEYSELQSKVSRTAPATDPVRQQMHQFLRTIPENWIMKKYTALPAQNYQAQFGRVISLKQDQQLGIMATASYRNDQDIEKRSLYAIYSNDFNGTNNKFSTVLGGSLHVGYKFRKHSLSLQSTFTQKFSDEMFRYTGMDGDNGDMKHDSYTNVTIISQMWQHRLGGEHTFTKKDIRLDWFASAAQVHRDQPWSRQMARLNGQPGEKFPPDYFRYDLSDNQLKNGNLFYSELREKMYNWAANVKVPFRLLQQPQLFKMGYAGKYRASDFGANLFRIYKFDFNRYNEGTPYDQIFTAENFGRDLYLHVVNGKGRDRDKSESAESYQGLQRLHAFYGMLDLKPLKKLRLIGGVRAERNEQQVEDYRWNDLQKTTEKSITRNEQTDWLPSVNAIYSITPKINFRAAWYKTVARPDLRELSSFAYWDYDLFGTVNGTPLKTTNISNADLRLEYYPAPGEVVSVSAFYKKFRDPIEMIVTFSSSSFVYRYDNLANAMDKGIELDFRKSFSFIRSRSGFWKDLYLSGNFTVLDASVTFYPDDAVRDDSSLVNPTRDRPLAGQSPYIINAGLLYAGKSIGLNLAYNRFGKRIVFASPNRASDEYENPRDVLDLQISYKFGKRKQAEVKLNISDLLNQELIYYRNMLPMDNRFGFPPGEPSVDRYPGSGEELKPEQKDPKGTSYNKDYDVKARGFKFGTTYTLNFTYRF
jgi:TonB-dependent receptor